MVEFSKIHSDIIPVLKEQGITEKELFAYDDRFELYIGCKSYIQAKEILTGGLWKAMSNIFRPQKGSDMDMFPYAVEIWGGYTHWLTNKINKNKSNS